jgi:hypothetical protein
MSDISFLPLRTTEMFCKDGAPNPFSQTESSATKIDIKPQVIGVGMVSESKLNKQKADPDSDPDPDSERFDK